MQLIISSRSVRGNGGCVEAGGRSILSASFFEGLLRHPVLLTPKTVGAALVEVFAAILLVEATTPLVSAPPDIRSEHGVCNA